MNLPDGENLLVKIVFWAIPVVFGAGAMYTNNSNTASQAQKNLKSLQAVEAAVTSHSAEPVGHPGTEIKLHQIESNQAQIIQEQKVTLQNIAAICQATGANCK
tara:strand:- start:587 stop:895 length:309 start_codon:yes stop_codon:yes gene_type:complete